MVFADPSAGRASAGPPASPSPGAAPGDVAPGPLPGGRASASPALWCSGVRKRYGRKRLALDGVSFEVARGEVLGLLGPNGAGKTSLIKILLGLVRADAGEVMLLGRPAGVGRARSRQGVGYLPELFRFQPWLSADEVLTLHARLARIDWSAERRRDALAEVGLADRAGDRVGGFSKGMQQRLGLAVALVGDPALVVLDEPTSALDPLGRADVRDLVLRLRERGTTVVLNSHLIGEVERVCDRVVILDHGRVVASGTLAELLGRRQVRLGLGGVGEQALARMRRVGRVTRDDDHFVVDLGEDTTAPDGTGTGTGSDTGTGTDTTADAGAVVPELIRDLVGLGVAVHAVEPVRISLEDRLLGLLRGPEVPS